MPTHPTGVHPEYLAKVADEARRFGRFSVNPTAEPAAGKRDQIVRWESPDTRSYSPRVVPVEFEAIMRPVLASARACKIFGAKALFTSALKGENAARRERWLDAYVVGRKDTTDVDLKARGVREDMMFWWWLAFRGAKPVLTTNLKDLDPAKLFAATDGPGFGTMRDDLPQSAITHATKEAARDTICFASLASPESIDIKVFAAKELAATLAAIAFERGSLGENERRTMAIFEPRVLHLWDASAAWMSVVEDNDPERVLLSLLRRGLKAADNARDGVRALTAAEVVAIMERRDPTGVEAHIIGDLRKWAPKQDVVEISTVELAKRVAEAVLEGGAIEAEKFFSAEGRSLWRTEVTGLITRLDAALLARRIQATAANARPRARSRVEPELLRRPERWGVSYFYALRDDAQALLDFVRDESSARLYVRDPANAAELRELVDSWELRQMLAESFDGQFDARRIDSPIERKQGIQIHVWWPEVSPPPELRPVPSDDEERDEDEDEDEDEEIAAELGLPPGAFGRDEYEVAGWGVPAILLCGAVAEQILPSALEHPTGGELKRPRYRGAGAWRDVDWTALRRNIRVLRAALGGPLSGGRLKGAASIPLLRTAAARVRGGWSLTGRNGFVTHAAIEWTPRPSR